MFLRLAAVDIRVLGFMFKTCQKNFLFGRCNNGFFSLETFSFYVCGSTC